MRYGQSFQNIDGVSDNGKCYEPHTCINQASMTGALLSTYEVRCGSLRAERNAPGDCTLHP